MKVFNDDTTFRLSFREGDVLLWFRFTNIFSNESIKILDAWFLSDGDYGTLTNRWEDIPSWFELYPLEVQGRYVYKMMMKVEEGYNPDGVMNGPNIWRINAGDTIAWLGKTRPDIKNDNGVLDTIRFNSNALLIGESANYNNIEGFIRFGSIRGFNEDEVKKAREVLIKIREEGIPRRHSTEWRLG